MKKFADILNYAVKEFKAAKLYFGHGTDNAWDEAVSLALYALQLPIDTDRRILEKELTSIEIKNICKLIELRIKKRLPAAYITNTAWFAGLHFYVDERVIIPRSPIAELIENNFNPWIIKHKVNKILELGAGSGCIAIACAKAFPDAQVDAVELSQEALEVAKINVENYKLRKQVRLLLGDLFTPVKKKAYDIIVSNPPYVSAEEMQVLPKEYKYEPYSALAGGGECGLDIVTKILYQASRHLNDNGVLIVEVGNNAQALENRFPKLSFMWPEFSRGGSGVFILNSTDCERISQEYR